MKRAISSSSSSDSDAKKRRVTYDTFTKWKRDYDRELQTLTWLNCHSQFDSGKRVVTKLSCSICSKYQDKIKGRKNFSEKWINGAESLRTSNLKDHAHTDQHKHAMSLLKKEQAQIQGLSPASYAPIAKALEALPEEDKTRLRNKFDIAYFIATEKLSFKKYPKLCELETKHGVDIGTTYTNEVAGRTFVHYIGEAKRRELADTLGKADFFSFLLDGSTDKGNCDNELVLIAWCDINGKDERIHTKMSFLKVFQPDSVSGVGLLKVIEGSLQSLGIQGIDDTHCYKLVGVATDGASANIASRGLKGIVQEKLPWIVWTWCIAHRIELAIKDALKGSAFDLIDEMLLRLYYLYEKSPKKCRELHDIVSDLKQCLQFQDSGVKPIRASGSRWVSHKVAALKRVLSKYGAYTNHLAALSEDPSVKSSDRAKLKGYYNKWTEGKYLIGCAVFVDILMPCSIFSKVMQSDEVDILGAITSLLKTIKETDKLSSKTLEEWPTFAATTKNISCDGEDEEKVYQCQELKKYPEGLRYLQNHHKEYCTKVIECIRSRMAWSDLELMRDIVFVLGTQGWEKAVEENDSMEAITRLTERFAIPLEATAAEVGQIAFEFDAVLHYAIQFISLSTLDYKAVWWRIFHSPSAGEWCNILILVKILFSLPASNGKLERVFSQVNLIKNEKRTLLSNETLNDLLVLTSDQTPLNEYSPDNAIDLWWSDKSRRPNQRKRKAYKKKRCCQPLPTTSSTPTSSTEELPHVVLSSESENDETNSDTSTCILDEWDTWMNDS